MQPFTKALTVVAQVMRDGAATHPDNDWVRRSPEYHLSRAEEHLRRDLELTKSSSAAIALADYYVTQNKEAAAREVLEPLAKSPESAGLAKTRLAALAQVTGHPDEAMTRVDEVLRSEPTDLSALLMKSGLKLDESVRSKSWE